MVLRARKILAVALFSALLATVFPLAPSTAAAAQNAAVELGDEPECQWLLTRLIDLDRCARARRDLLSSAGSVAAAPRVGSAPIAQVAAPG